MCPTRPHLWTALLIVVWTEQGLCHRRAPHYLTYLYDANRHQAVSRDLSRNTFTTFCGIPNSGVDITSENKWKLAFPVKHLRSLENGTRLELVFTLRKPVSTLDGHTGTLCVPKLQRCYQGQLKPRHRPGTKQHWHIFSLDDGKWLSHVLHDSSQEEVHVHFTHKSQTGSQRVSMPYHVTGRDGPLLVVYKPTVASQDEVHQHLHRIRRSVVSDKSSEVSLEADEGGADDTGCRARPLVVDFRSFGWDWIISPRTIDCGYCAGLCPKSNAVNVRTRHPASLDSDHNQPASFETMKDMFNQATFLSYPDSLNSKCVPTKYDPFSFLYFDNDGNILYGRVSDLIVKECACRM